MEKWFSDLLYKYDKDRRCKKVKVTKVEKPYIERDNSKKNHTKNINHARKAKFIRQGR
jgi:hypothetical protein